MHKEHAHSGMTHMIHFNAQTGRNFRYYSSIVFKTSMSSPVSFFLSSALLKLRNSMSFWPSSFLSICYTNETPGVMHYNLCRCTLLHTAYFNVFHVTNNYVVICTSCVYQHKKGMCSVYMHMGKRWHQFGVSTLSTFIDNSILCPTPNKLKKNIKQTQIKQIIFHKTEHIHN